MGRICRIITTTFCVVYQLFIPRKKLANCGGRLWSFLVYNMLIYWFGIGSFLGGDIASDFILFFILGMRFSGVTLAPITPNKTETSLRILVFTIIHFRAGGSDWLIKFGALITFCDLKYSLGMKFFINWCHKFLL